MIKDIELIIGRKIRGLKNTNTINIENCKIALKHVHLLKNTWSLENDQVTVKNGNFTACFEFTVDNLVMLAKRWQKGRIEALPVQKQAIKRKKPTLIVIKKRYNLRYEFRNRLKVA